MKLSVYDSQVTSTGELSLVRNWLGELNDPERAEDLLRASF
jgi:hypothetical protein